MVMGGDSCSKGREFESWQCIPDGHFSHLFVVIIVMCEKEAGFGPFLKKKIFY